MTPGLVAALAFLELNGFSIEDPSQRLYDAMIGLATRTGYSVRASREDATLARLEKSLTPSAAPLPVQPLAA